MRTFNSKNPDEQLALINKSLKILQAINRMVPDQELYPQQSISYGDLALYLKDVAVSYNCVIISWKGYYEANAEVYNAAIRDEDAPESYELCAAADETSAICLGFEWLFQQGYFSEEFLIKEDDDYIRRDPASGTAS